MRVLFIVNPAAGRGMALKTWTSVQKRLTGLRTVDAVVPASRADTRRSAAEAVRAGIERVVVVGGDGTLNAVAAVLPFTDTSLGFIPAGTGNDFGRNCGLPRRLDAALAVALGKRAERIDLGLVEGGGCFVNAAGVGFDAEVAAAATAYPSRLGGTLPYLLGALRVMGAYRPVDVEVTVDDQRYSGPVTLVVVANGRYYGGGMRIAPPASPRDGELDVCIAAGMGRAELLALMPRVYAGGHLRHPKVHMLRGGRVTLRPSAQVRMHLDGEPGDTFGYAFRAQPGALWVAVPPA